MIESAAPQAPVSVDGLVRLRAELEGLSTVTRPGLEQTIQRAKLFFDPAEEAATLDVAERDLALLDRQIARLDRLVKLAEAGSEAPVPPTVQEGVAVTVRFDDGSPQVLTVVSPADAYPSLGFISSESPVGKAILGKRPGDRVSIDVGGQPVNLLIEKIGLTPTTSSK